MEKLLASKEKEFLEKIGLVATKSAELEGMRAEHERMANEFIKFRMEKANHRAENEKLKVKLKGKSLALEQKDKTINDLKEDYIRAIKEKEEDQVKDLKVQHEDFVNQMMVARNDYFLEGWKAAMIQTGVDQSSSMYKDVPWPNPDEEKLLFSFKRQSLNPSSDAELKEDDAEEEEEAKSSKNVTFQPPSEKALHLLAEEIIHKAVEDLIDEITDEVIKDVAR